MNIPPKPTRKQTASALLVGFIAGYLTRLTQRTAPTRKEQQAKNEGFIRSVLAELRASKSTRGE